MTAQVLAQTPETSSSTTTPSLPIIQIQQLIFNNTSWFLLSSDVDCLPLVHQFRPLVLFQIDILAAA